MGYSSDDDKDAESQCVREAEVLKRTGGVSNHTKKRPSSSSIKAIGRTPFIGILDELKKTPCSL